MKEIFREAFAPIGYDTLDDRELIALGRLRQNLWQLVDILPEAEEWCSSAVMCRSMQELYAAALKRAQHTDDLHRLSVLVPPLYELVYAPFLPVGEDCLLPIDALAASFIRTVASLEAQTARQTSRLHPHRPAWPLLQAALQTVSAQHLLGTPSSDPLPLPHDLEASSSDPSAPAQHPFGENSSDSPAVQWLHAHFEAWAASLEPQGRWPDISPEEALGRIRLLQDHCDPTAHLLSAYSSHPSHSSILSHASEHYLSHFLPSHEAFCLQAETILRSPLRFPGKPTPESLAAEARSRLSALAPGYRYTAWLLSSIQAQTGFLLCPDPLEPACV